LGFQYPTEVSGVGFSHFLRTSYNALSKALKDDEREVFITVREFQKYLKENVNAVGMKDEFLSRYLNEGFSGGEKKKNEILQMTILEPKLAIFDETDSGLDIDALRIVSDGVNALRSKERSFLIITHYQRLLDYIKPDFVHVLVNGKIAKTGCGELAEELEKVGYERMEIGK